MRLSDLHALEANLPGHVSENSELRVTVAFPYWPGHDTSERYARLEVTDITTALDGTVILVATCDLDGVNP